MQEPCLVNGFNSLEPVSYDNPDATSHCGWTTKDRIVLRTLKAAPSLEVLFDLKDTNTTFNNVYENNALSLMQGTLWKMSPPLWELREMGIPWATPGTENYLHRLPVIDEQTPTVTAENYLCHYEYEICVLARLIGHLFSYKNLHENGMAISAIHDALVRIWTFCRIFGCGKYHQADWEGQQEWLAGGVRANGLTGSFSFGWESSEVLALAPEGFGRGNSSGLSIRQTKIMQSVWRRLQQRLRHKVEQDFAIRPPRGWNSGDVDTWVSYILTLGLAAVDCLLLSNNPLQEAEDLGWVPTPAAIPPAGFLQDACTRWLNHLLVRQPSVRHRVSLPS
ncbi:hypothetical protein FE257_002325 [Aspergillus nanangensis]|uniref:Uncharacterized protein n=1 Tax=Aspergillus nanangensis TaxID=2582783 RepID=A0AAD4GP52_ASPNN|nr:hypothetical protein FE257_002325 [Aspergillus nanangensis]